MKIFGRALLGGLCLANMASAETVVMQNFDTATNWNYAIDVALFDNGWGDDGYLGIINTNSAALLDYGNFAAYIFGENDLEAEGDHGTNGFATITFESVDIRTFTGVQISFDYQAVGYNAQDDDLKYEILHDGTGQGAEMLHDGGVDPNDSEGHVRITIPDNVTNVALKVMIRNNGKDGFSGFDNFLIENGIAPRPDDPAACNATTMGSDSIDLSFTTNAAGSAIVISYNQDGTFTIPSNAPPAIGQSFAGGTLLYNNTGANYSHTGLAGSAHYYYKAWSVDDSNTYSDGLTADAITDPVPAAGLGPGSIAFVGVNTDGNDDLAFVCIERIPDSQEITFTDEEWDGTSFGTGEGDFAWTAPGGGVRRGIVVTFRDIQNVTRSVNVGSMTSSNNWPNFEVNNEGIFAIRGTREAPVAFLAGFSNDGVAGFTTLAGTGLTEGQTAIDFEGTPGADKDIFTYTGPRTIDNDFANYLPLINNPMNWIYEGGNGDQHTNASPPDVPFDTTPLESKPPTVFMVN